MVKNVVTLFILSLLTTMIASAQDSLNVTTVSQLNMGAQNVTNSGSCAYVVGGDLCVVDVSIPAAPIELGNFRLPSWAFDVAVSGSYAYVANYDDGLRIIDVSNPADPYEVGYCNMLGTESSVAVSGSYAYVVTMALISLRVVDISDPSAPSEVGCYNNMSGGGKDVAISGSYAYVAAETGGLYIIDISNPTAPVEVGHCNTWGAAHGVAVSGDYAYVADGTWDGLVVIDISNPFAPVEVGSCDTPGGAYKVAVSGFYAYIADLAAGLRVIDVSDPLIPVEVGHHRTPGNTLGVSTTESHIYVADESYFGIYQFSLPVVTITMTPVGAPIQIPASGGSFDFNVSIDNGSSSPASVDVWIMVQLPDSSWFGPVLGPVRITVPGGGSITRLRTQAVPESAPAGIYNYTGYTGYYPFKLESSSFTFEKLDTGDSEIIGEWLNTGNDLLSNQVTSARLPSSFCLFPCHPNPFNPSTVIGFVLPKATHVNLIVYDLQGRAVCELVDGIRHAGVHEVTWEASDRASGIYFYQIEAGGFNAVRKMVLVK